MTFLLIFANTYMYNKSFDLVINNLTNSFLFYLLSIPNSKCTHFFAPFWNFIDIFLQLLLNRYFKAVTLNIVNRYLSVLSTISLGFLSNTPQHKWWLMENENWIICFMSWCITSLNVSNPGHQRIWLRCAAFNLKSHQVVISHFNRNSSINDANGRSETSDAAICLMKVRTGMQQ